MKHNRFSNIVKVIDTGIDTISGNLWIEYTTLDDRDKGKDDCNIRQRTKKRNR